MLASNLPSPGVLSNGQTLRHASAHAISRAEINAGNSPDSDTAAQLLIFFNACAAACSAVMEDPTEEGE